MDEDILQFLGHCVIFKTLYYFNNLSVMLIPNRQTCGAKSFGHGFGPPSFLETIVTRIETTLITAYFKFILFQIHPMHLKCVIVRNIP